MYVIISAQNPCPRDALRSPKVRGSLLYGSLSRGVDILDTGVRITHEDFGGRAVAGWSAYCNDVDDGACGDAGVVGGVITAERAGCNGHGTHVASTAAGARYGVAKAATIVAVQALNCYGGGTTAGSTAPTGLERARRLQGGCY